MKTFNLTIFFNLIFLVCSYSQPFVEKNIGLNKFVNLVHFVDVDKNGYFDVPADSVWLNNGVTFTKTFFGINLPIGDWGDFDNDGDLDLISGTVLYRNDGAFFTQVNVSSPNIYGFSTWGDYDNDGLLDFYVMGSQMLSTYGYIFHNNGNGTFSNSINIGGLAAGYATWGDYDKDGDLDLILAGSDGQGYNPLTKQYRNDNGVFTYVNSGITGGGNNKPIIWADYDNDGDLDVMVNNRIYQNNNGVFTLITTSCISSPNGLSMGDFDNDGDLDLISQNMNNGTKVYNNNAGTFTDISAGINFSGLLLGDPGISSNYTAWGDYNNDGNLDILVSGIKNSVTSTKIFTNSNTTVNTKPNSPTDLVSSVIGNSVTFRWNPSTDNETPSPGLSYNIFIGTTSTTSDLYPTHANLSTGKRYIASRGMIQDTSITIHLNNLSACTNYYWSVQAIDAGLEGSAFAVVQTFQLPLQINTSTNTSIICGENAQLNVTSNYGGILNYLWSNSGSLSSGTIQNPVATPEITTIYSVTVTDGNLCTAIDSMQVIVNNLVVNAGSDTTFICGNNIQLGAIVNSYSSSVNYSWSPSSSLDNASSQNPVASVIDTIIYIVTVSDGLYCTNSDTVKVSPISANVSFPEICMVGIDQVTNKNMIIWEKPVTSLISDYVIYKETTQSGIYFVLDTIQFSSESIYIDTASDPYTMAYRYKISSRDICGDVFPLSNYHKTIHLTINQGTGTNWNLIWSPYEGFAFSTYNIYRGASTSSMFLIAQVQSNLFSFTNDPGSGTYYYQIEAVNPNPCNSGSKTIYTSSKSNIVNTILVNTLSISGNHDIELYPNPTNDKVKINLDKPSNGITISVSTFQGKVIKRFNFINKESIEINLKELDKGLYIVTIESEDTVVNKKLIKY